jgi:hypothetical protein
MFKVDPSGSVRGSAERQGPDSDAAGGDPTVQWSDARRRVIGVLRDRPRGVPESGVAAMAELSEDRVRHELRALADTGFARCAPEHVTWGCEVVEVPLWHIVLTEPCVRALAFLPRRRPRGESTCPSKVPAEFWPMFWSGARGSDAVLPRDAFHVACTLLDCPDRAAQAWALRHLPIEALESCRSIRGYDTGEIASAIDATLAVRRQDVHGRN